VDDLEPASPSAVGLDSARLNVLVRDLQTGRYPDIHSLLIVRHGRLAVEEYFNGATADAVHTLQSVTKSFASALIGIAIDEGVLRGVDERVVDFFPQWRDELAQDPRRAAQRIEDILTMRTGTDYEEGYPGSPHDQLNQLATDPAGGDEPIRAAVGFGGQYVFVIRDRDMVVVVTAGAETAADMNRPVDFLYSDILPATSR
jgi:CubicO group peptidase (beta-lactamase class C family)